MQKAGVGFTKPYTSSEFTDGHGQTDSSAGEKNALFSDPGHPVNWNLLPRQVQDERALLALIVDKGLPSMGCDSSVRSHFDEIVQKA